MQSLDRFVATLEAVASSSNGATVLEVAGRAGLSASTTSRLLRALEARGLVERMSSRGPYVLGYRTLAIAKAAASATPLLEAAFPRMQQLRDDVGETVSLHIRTGSTRTCIAEVQSTFAVRRVVPLGLALPLHLGATGVLLMAGFDEEELARYKQSLPSAYRSSVPDLAAIRASASLGWASQADTWQAGLSGIAAPITIAGAVVAVLAISGPSDRFGRSAMLSALPSLLTATRHLSDVSAQDSRHTR